MATGNSFHYRLLPIIREHIAQGVEFTAAELLARLTDEDFTTLFPSEGRGGEERLTSQAVGLSSGLSTLVRCRMIAKPRRGVYMLWRTSSGA